MRRCETTTNDGSSIGDDGGGSFIVTAIVTTHRHRQKPAPHTGKTLVFGSRVTMGDDNSSSYACGRARTAHHACMGAQFLPAPAWDHVLSSPIVTTRRKSLSTKDKTAVTMAVTMRVTMKSGLLSSPAPRLRPREACFAADCGACGFCFSGARVRVRAARPEPRAPSSPAHPRDAAGEAGIERAAGGRPCRGGARHSSGPYSRL